jgi:hypothetical protein
VRPREVLERAWLRHQAGHRGTQELEETLVAVLTHRKATPERRAQLREVVGDFINANT